MVLGTTIKLKEQLNMSFRGRGGGRGGGRGFGRGGGGRGGRGGYRQMDMGPPEVVTGWSLVGVA